MMNSKWFEEIASDPVRRRAAIVTLSRLRILLVCCALISTAGAIDMFFTAAHGSKSPALFIPSALGWMAVIQINARLQVLTWFEKFRK